MDKISSQKAHFESISEQYYNARKSENHLLYKDLLWTYLFDLVEWTNTPRSVLEPMCGYAEGKKIIEKYVNKEIQYSGFDFSEVLVDLVKRHNPEINIYLGDVTQFSTDTKYDLVILIGGLHHVPDYCEKVLSRIYTSLNDGGRFINFEPTNNNSLFRIIRENIYNKNDLFDESTERAFELNELNEMYNNAGFRIEKQIYPGLLSYILYYNPDAFPFLNIGKSKTVKRFFSIDKFFIQNSIGKKLSFATLSILKK